MVCCLVCYGADHVFSRNDGVNERVLHDLRHAQRVWGRLFHAVPCPEVSPLWQPYLQERPFSIQMDPFCSIELHPVRLPAQHDRGRSRKAELLRTSGTRPQLAVGLPSARVRIG